MDYGLISQSSVNPVGYGLLGPRSEAPLSKSVAIIGTRGYPSYYGGFETAVRRLAPYLADAGWDVTVYGRLGSVREGDPSLDPRITNRVTRGFDSKSLSTLSYGLSASAIALTSGKHDVALIMNVANGFWLPFFRLRRVPTLVNVDGIEWERAKWGRVGKSVFRAGARMVAKFANELVFDASEIGRIWRERYNRTGKLISYGGDEVGRLPVEHGLKHGGYIIIVARFVPENSILEFIEAAESLSEQWPVVLVGSSGYGGEIEERVRNLVQTRDSVHWLGHVSDDSRLHSLWAHAGVYFHGHSVGGTNPALVQAMACGAPIVARDTVYNREVLGNAGVFAEPNPSSIAHQIAGLMKNADRRVQLSNDAIRRARELYAWSDVCARYADALEQLRAARRKKK